MSALRKWAILIFLICGGWTGLMSGGLTVPFTIAAFCFQGHGRTLFVFLAFSALLIFALRVVYKNYQLLEKQKPKFKLSCRDDVPGCAVNSPGNNCRYFRLSVQTDGLTTAHKCRGWLAKIEKSGKVLFDSDRRDLPFAPSESPDSLEKAIFPNTPYHLDVVAVAGGNVYICIKGGLPALDTDGKPIFHEYGDYILTVGVCGENVPTQIVKLKFSVKQDWLTNTLEMV